MHDWTAEARKWASAMTPKVRGNLCRHLGLPDTALDCFPLLGLREDQGGKHFTFPEVDGRGRVVGLCRRYGDGQKFQLKGGERGLSVPHGFDPKTCKVVYCVEGPTDVAAVWASGLPAVGRPSNTAGAGELACLLQDCPDDCRIVLVGENDRKADHDWPGLHGAAQVADQVASILQRRPGCKKYPVTWSLCPDGVKDVRAWLTRPAWGVTPWAERGRQLAAKLDAGAVVAEPVDKVVRKLMAEHEQLKRDMAEVRAMLSAILQKA